MAEGNVFFAEEILEERRTQKGEFEYLVKWKGWSKRQSTWEPVQNLFDHRLLQHFKLKQEQSSNDVKDELYPSPVSRSNISSEIRGSKDVEDELHPSPMSRSNISEIRGVTRKLGVLSGSPNKISMEVEKSDSFLDLKPEDVLNLTLNTTISSVNMTADNLEDELILSPKSETFELRSNTSDIVEVESHKSGTLEPDSLFIELQDTESRKHSHVKSSNLDENFELPIVITKSVIGQRQFWHQQSITDIFRLAKTAKISEAQMTKAIPSPKDQVLARYSEYIKKRETLDKLKELDTYSSPRLKIACDFKCNSCERNYPNVASLKAHLVVHVKNLKIQKRKKFSTDKDHLALQQFKKLSL